ncbi:Arsenite transporter [Ceratobasidium theobromae]|uniref:Arsenite transporter n=1 Tax=Ceratobasidium theobromae TaxID=1582974 RepID=A0A5N5QD59_9AGAM|nr:Arsenite transporter [Ceratobasidium theobromae]
MAPFLLVRFRPILPSAPFYKVPLLHHRGPQSIAAMAQSTAPSSGQWHDIYPTPPFDTPRITAESLSEMVAQKVAGIDFVVVDVRRTDFESMVIRGAINLPAHSFYPTLLTVTALLSRIPNVIFHCNSCTETGRGPRVAGWYAEQLKTLGITTSKAWVLEGGIKRFGSLYGDNEQLKQSNTCVALFELTHQIIFVVPPQSMAYAEAVEPPLRRDGDKNMREMDDLDPPLFRPSCTDCTFCDGLRDMGTPAEVKHDGLMRAPVSATTLFRSLSFLDRYLAMFILLAMITGVLIGVYKEEAVQHAFGGASWQGTSIPILLGLLVMMWPVLTKVQYERLPTIFTRRDIWLHIAISLVLNWIIAPFIMLGLAWATLPESHLERERKGVILVGVARCIAMVLIWNGLACGDPEYCAILVCINSLLQMVLFSPYALLFLNVLGGGNSPTLHLDYRHTAASVGIYLGIPLAAGIVTRFTMKRILSRSGFDKFLKFFGPFALLGLLYTIIVLFAFQGHRVVQNIGSVFRIFVPLILYFIIVWFTTFFGLYSLNRRSTGPSLGGYEKAVVQSFTAGSNNFELAIAVAIASFGTESPEALAATIGPLVEVPVLLALTLASKFEIGYGMFGILDFDHGGPILLKKKQIRRLGSSLCYPWALAQPSERKPAHKDAVHVAPSLIGDEDLLIAFSLWGPEAITLAKSRFASLSGCLLAITKFRASLSSGYITENYYGFNERNKGTRPNVVTTGVRQLLSTPADLAAGPPIAGFAHSSLLLTCYEMLFTSVLLLAASALSFAAPSVVTGLRKSESLGSHHHGIKFNDIKGIPANARLLTIELRGKARLDGINLILASGEKFTHGGQGGKLESMTLFNNEFITLVKLCQGQKDGHTRIFYAEVRATTGRTIKAGTETDDCKAIIAPNGLGVVGAFGRSGNEIDRLGFIYSQTRQ